MLPSFGTTPSPHPQFPYTITHKLIFPCVCASNIRLDDVFLTGVLAAKAGLVLVDIQVHRTLDMSVALLDPPGQKINPEY